MALSIEKIEERGEELTVWNLPENLPENPNVRLKVLGNFSGLTPGEMTRVNFGVTEAARVITEGGGTRPIFGYSIEPKTRNVYSITHQGVCGQAPVEGLIIKRGPVTEPEFVLFQAGRV